MPPPPRPGEAPLSPAAEPSVRLMKSERSASLRWCWLWARTSLLTEDFVSLGDRCEIVLVGFD